MRKTLLVNIECYGAKGKKKENKVLLYNTQFFAIALRQICKLCMSNRTTRLTGQQDIKDCKETTERLRLTCWFRNCMHEGFYYK